MSLEGQQIGRYRIVRLLGSGGMGEVYLAEDARIEQQVAIKLIRSEIGPYPNGQTAQDAARLTESGLKIAGHAAHRGNVEIAETIHRRRINHTVRPRNAAHAAPIGIAEGRVNAHGIYRIRIVD